jgi:hypothetical protein
MKKLITLIVAIACLIGFVGSSFAGYVRPYNRHDGTFVPGHYRTNPDGNPYNNRSYLGW